MLQRGEEEGAEFAFAAINVGQVIFIEQAREEGLGEILRVVRIRALPPNEGVKRIPIGLAKILEGALGLFGGAARIEDDSPMRGHELDAAIEARFFVDLRHSAAVRREEFRKNRRGWLWEDFPFALRRTRGTVAGFSMLQQQAKSDAVEFSEAADWAALEEQLGSPDEATAVGAAARVAAIGGVENAAQLREFVAQFQMQALAENELPVILRAYNHARRGEARELIEMDRSLRLPITPALSPSDGARGRTFANEALANASRAVGRNQLRKLRSLKDQRVVRKYWDAVHAQQASGWHTIVFGIVLAIYSIPLRQGLHHYSRQTLRGFLEAGAGKLRLRVAEIDEMETALVTETPAIVERVVAAEAGPFRCV
jgi:urease accessory protein UreF